MVADDGVVVAVQFGVHIALEYVTWVDVDLDIDVLFAALVEVLERIDTARGGAQGVHCSVVLRALYAPD